MRKFLKILVLVITIAAIGCLWFFTHKEHVERPLQRVELTIVRPNEDGFIDRLAEYQKIMRICDTVHNNLVTMIPIDSVRNYIATIPWATYTEAEMTFDEIMKIQIVECQPVMRIYNRNGQSVYLDENGNIFPESTIYTPHLIIGSGNLNFKAVRNHNANIADIEYANSDLSKMFNVMKSVLNNSYSKICVKQVYYENKNYELVLNNVDLKVILGNDKNVDLKLMNLKYFLEKMQGSEELAKYKQINFNFENQVVCTKNNKNKR